MTMQHDDLDTERSEMQTPEMPRRLTAGRSAVAWACCILLSHGCTSTSEFQHPCNAETITLNNDHVYLAVSPELGRITGFGPRSGDNLLWIGEEHDVVDRGRGWRNWGGDKVWPSPQKDWASAYGKRWPPPPDIDGPPWEVLARGERSLVIQSPASEVLGVQIRREIELARRNGVVTIRNVVTRVRPSGHRVHVWSVSQICLPSVCLLDVMAERPDSTGVHVFEDRPATADAVSPVSLSVVCYDPPKEGTHKVGTYGQWMAAVYPRWVFAQYTSPPMPAAVYADQSNLQVYSDHRYAELETTTPVEALNVGESIQSTVTWRLFPRPEGATLEDISRMIDHDLGRQATLEPR